MDYLQILIDLHYITILTINQTKNIIKRKEKGWASGWNGTRKSCELRNGKGTSRMSDLLFELVDEATNDKLQIYENRIKFTKKERTAAGCNVMTKTFPISALRSVQIKAPGAGSAGFLQVSSGSGAVCREMGPAGTLRNENSISVAEADYERAKQIKEYLEGRIAK